jgi:co-chaperonin GroES (HSP10)
MIKRTFFNNVLVRQLRQEELERNGLLIHSNFNKKMYDNGIVVAIPDSLKGKVNIGDKVFFNQTAGINVSFNKEKFILLSMKEIFGSFSDNIDNIEITNTNVIDGLINKIENQINSKFDKSIQKV